MTPKGRGRGASRRLTIVGMCSILTATGCAFGGLNSLSLPGTVGRGPGSTVYHFEISNVGTLEANSPVMVDDVVVGSVRSIEVRDWRADVEVSVQADAVVPANAIASIGQTSLLGSMHVELNPPLGRPPTGRLAPGATIPLNRTKTYPSTEQTLSSLSTVVNGGGLGRFGDVIHNFNAALSGNEGQVRDLLGRLNDFVGTLDEQRDNLISSAREMNRLAATFAGQRDVLTQALNKIPPALDVLIRERPNITAALDKLRVFSDTATALVNGSKADLVRDLTNLEPTFRALADVGPGINDALAYSTVFPFGQGIIDRGLKGDYMNLFAVFDLTVPRLKRTMFLGTRWGAYGAELVPAPGEPGYEAHIRDNPTNALVTVPPEGTGPPPPMGTGNLPMPPFAAPAPQPVGLPLPPWGQAPPPPSWQQLMLPPPSFGPPTPPPAEVPVGPPIVPPGFPVAGEGGH